MTARIKQELIRLEQEQQIRILYAVESGSRAWGFASQDSDWDVRFIYVHQLEWYLQIDEDRDSYEEMLDCSPSMVINDSSDTILIDAHR